jgi:hypothetical protein
VEEQPAVALFSELFVAPLPDDLAEELGTDSVGDVEPTADPAAAVSRELLSDGEMLADP